MASATACTAAVRVRSRAALSWVRLIHSPAPVARIMATRMPSTDTRRICWDTVCPVCFLSMAHPPAVHMLCAAVDRGRF